MQVSDSTIFRSRCSQRLGVPSRRVYCGFTLIELLVVIGIIALLIAILLPVLSSVRGVGRSAVCLSNMRTLAQSANTFAVDHKDQLPSNRVRTPAVPEYETPDVSTHITWRAYLVLKGYLPDGPDAQDEGDAGQKDGSAMWACPSSPTPALSEEGRSDGVTFCVDDVESNYGYNGMLAWRYPPPFDAADIDLVKVRQPSHTIVFLETRSVWPDLRENSIDGRGPTFGAEDDGGGYFSWWHQGDGNWATFDGSVTSMGLLETVEGTPRWRNVAVDASLYSDWPDRVASVYR